MMADFESRLRTQLADAAEGAPVFTGVDPERTAGQTGAPTHASPHHRPRRWMAVAAAAAVAAAVAAGVSWWPIGSGGGDGAASCAARLVLAEHVYSGYIDPLRVPRSGASLGTAVMPSCDDGQGPSGREQMEAFEIPGINPEVAILTHGGLWLNKDVNGLPDWVQELNKPVPCTGAGETTIAGDLIGIDAPPAEQDFHVRTPYTANFVADEGSTLPLTEYTSVTIRMRVTAATTGGRDPEFIRLALTEGDRVSATVRCDGSHFQATSLELAP